MVNDEDDIIRHTIMNRMAHFDLMAIIDSSHDGTSKICKELMEHYPGKILYKWDDTPLTIKYFRMKLYGMLMDAGIDDDTWIWQLDTDIFPDLNRQDIIAAEEHADGEEANCMIARIAQFYPTFEDIENKTYWRDFLYYSLNWRSKIIYKGISKLFFKGDDQETPSVPDERKSRLSPVVKHYQYRSPEQIQKKIDRAYKVRSYSHIISQNWKDFVIDREFLSKWNDDSHRRPHHSWRSLVALTKEKHGSVRP
jgi:hypothetical protein